MSISWSYHIAQMGTEDTPQSNTVTEIKAYLYGVDDTTSNLWSRYQNNSENGYYPSNSGEGVNSFTVDDAYWWAIRIGGWSDNSNPLTFYGIFYMGEK